jgi:hypothetical protein
MKLNELFRRTEAYWARYDEYEYREHDDKVFIMPTAAAKVSVYDPMKVADSLVVDALNVWLLCMREEPDEERIRADLLAFAANYGLLGFMPALPTTPDFEDYDSVYLPKNPIIRAESMDANEYVGMFFPFEKPDFRKDKSGRAEMTVNFDRNDKMQFALALTFQNAPWSMSMALRRNYGEPAEWVRKQLSDWATSFCASDFYYETKDETERELYKSAMFAFGGATPRYRVALYDDGPKLVWTFHSLLQTIQMVFHFALTDGQHPLRVCKYCAAAFVAQDPRSLFCSPECKNRYNVRMSRNRDRGGKK